MPEITVDDTITNAVIAALQNEQDRYTTCVGLAANAPGHPSIYETDRAAGQTIRDRYGKEVAGELTGYVNWVRVGQHFREEAA